MSQISRDITDIARCGAQYRVGVLAPQGLKPCHASYLTEISAHPGISQDQLARRICINKSNVARQVAVLEEDGFITRHPSLSDKRTMELYPTRKTLELLPQIQALLEQWETYLTSDLTPEEAAQFSKILSRIQIKAALWMEHH